MDFRMTVEIPALERLCDLIEKGKARLTVPEACSVRIPAGENKQNTETVAASETPTVPEPQEGPQEPPTAEPTNVSPTPAATPTATLADVQQACATLRDAGKMAEVKALFPEFGIKKLSDLKTPEQLGAFAGKLRGLGARI